MVRKFLGCITVLTLLAVAAAFAVYQFGDRMIAQVATPKGHFEAPPPSDTGPDYADAASWLARPADGIGLADWRPDGAEATPSPSPSTATHKAATFFIHPTTYLATDRWNAPVAPGGETETRSQLFVRHQASVFGDVGDVWAPRYRQAAFGAFLLDNADAKKALDLAYGDVVRAFDVFLAANPDRPIILAGHSQGALHLLRLLGDRGGALKGRLVAAYVVGWPVGITADLHKTGLDACRTPTDTACVLSWQSFGSPANPNLVLNSWVGTKGLTGAVHRRADMLCTDPVSGTIGGSSPASANAGTLNPDAAFTTATVVPGQVGATCDKGFLIVDGQIPPLGAFSLPGNNLHPYDYALFWGSIRRDVARRLGAMERAR